VKISLPLRHLLPILLIVVPLFLTVVHGQQAPICRDAQECRELALDAAMRGEYERFHDLAWRAVQTGPKNDSTLMYLLARAQVLSGRPHDALVMLKRLADMGVATDAASDPDFERTRALPGWPEVAAATADVGKATPPPRAAAARGGRGAATAGPRTPAAAPNATAVPPVAGVFPLEAVASNEAVRFSTGQFLAAGLAYDAVSRRFVIGDGLGRKLIVVGDGADHADVLVRGESAGFNDVIALAIDELRGNLWVVGASVTSGESALHRLQLVSGRSLKSYGSAPSVGSTQLVDLAVQVSGDVIALDSFGNRLLRLPSAGSEMIPALSLKVSGARSVAARNDNLIFIAHDAGIARVDLRSGAVTALSVPKGFDLGRFDTIRAHGDVLIGLQTTPAGSRQLVRLTLNPAGRAVTKGTVIDPQVAEIGGHVSVSITGNELYYLATDGADAGAPSSNREVPFVVRHLTLR